jgi:hypothetical protein
MGKGNTAPPSAAGERIVCGVQAVVMRQPRCVERHHASMVMRTRRRRECSESESLAGLGIWGMPIQSLFVYSQSLVVWSDVDGFQSSLTKPIALVFFRGRRRLSFV